jgi:hypothetical protein
MAPSRSSDAVESDPALPGTNSESRSRKIRCGEEHLVRIVRGADANDARTVATPPSPLPSDDICLKLAISHQRRRRCPAPAGIRGDGC